MNREIVELREVVQKLVPLLAGKGLTVTQRGSQAYVQTNPHTRVPEIVNIPNISDNAKPDFIRAIQGFIDHEVAHVLHTDWNFYGGGVSAADLRKPEVKRFLNTHNIVEDTMIERMMVKTFPGSERNLSDTRKYFLSRITAEALKTAKDEKEAFIYLLVPTMRALAGHVEMQEFMDAGGYWSNTYVDGVVTGLKPETLELLKVCTTTKETLAISRELHEILYPPKPVTLPAPEPEEETEEPPKAEKPKEESEPKAEPESKDEEPEADPASESEDEETDEELVEEPDLDEDEPADEDDFDKEDEELKDAGPGDGDEDHNHDETGDDGEGDVDSDDEENSSEEGTEPGDEDDDLDLGGLPSDDDDLDLDGEEATAPAPGGPDDGEGENDEADGDDAISGKSPFRTEGADGGGVGGIDDEINDEPVEGSGGGVGNAGARAVFDFDVDAFEEADMSSQIAILISDEAVVAMDKKQYLVFTQEMDRIEPVKVPEKMNGTWIPKMEDEVRAMTSRMQKDIERIMASQSHVIRTPGHRHGRLHAPSLFRVSQGDPRVFSQRQEHVSKDTAVCLLCDNSGSMHGEKMKLGMISAYALSLTLDRVKINHEVIGFTSGGYYDMPHTMREAMADDVKRSKINYDRIEPIIMPIYKDYKERITAEVKARFAYMMFAQHGLAGNIDGESLEYAALRLMKQPEKRKVMLVLSDGQPAGSVKSGPHLATVVKDLEKSGIECIGIGIMDKSVSRYYPKHVVLNDVSQLPTEVMSALRAILA